MRKIRNLRRKGLIAIIAVGLLAGTNSCASWWSASFGPGGPRINVGGSLPTKSSSSSSNKKTTKGQTGTRTNTRNDSRNDDIYN